MKPFQIDCLIAGDMDSKMDVEHSLGLFGGTARCGIDSRALFEMLSSTKHSSICALVLTYRQLQFVQLHNQGLRPGLGLTGEGGGDASGLRKSAWAESD